MHLLVIYGPPASGKMIIGREVAELSCFSLFHDHLIMDALSAVFPVESSQFVKLCERFWTETIEAAAWNGRSLIFTLCSEANGNPAFLKTLEELVERAGGTVSYVGLLVSEEEQRRSAPSEIGAGIRCVQVLRSSKGDFDTAMAQVRTQGSWIDVTSTSASEVAKQIAANLPRQSGVFHVS